MGNGNINEKKLEWKEKKNKTSKIKLENKTKQNKTRKFIRTYKKHMIFLRLERWKNLSWILEQSALYMYSAKIIYNDETQNNKFLDEIL